MKLSLLQIAAIIDESTGRLSPVLSTEQVLRNKLRVAVDEKRLAYVHLAKKRSFESWLRIFDASGVFG